MPRDASGNYTLPASNPVITGTVIESNWANTTMPDLGNEITDSLSRSGEGGMLAPLKNVNGTALLPAWTFNNDVQSGMYLNAPSEIYLSVATVPMMRWTATGVEAWNVSTSTWGSVGNMFAGPNPSLANTDAAIIIGTKEPDISLHIEIGPTLIQAKSGTSSPLSIGINTLGGDVELGQFGGTDKVYAYGDQFIADNTPTSGGVLRTFSTDANEYGDGFSAVTAQRYISSVADTVSVAKVRSNVLIGDLNGRNTRIYNSSIQNVDGTGDVGDTFSINPLGGDVYVGPQLNAGDVRLYHTAGLSAQTIDPAAGGLNVNNTLTGAGLERVLTLSDLSTPQFDVVIDGGNPSLINANCALTTGTDDPDTFPHIAYGVNLIQAKSDGTTASTLFINDLGGNITIGSNSGAGQVTIRNGSGVSASTVSAASGGLFVNNLDTGVGLERALTSSDITAPVVAGATPARYSYVIDQPSIAYDYIVGGDAPSTTFTIGATGSGADRIFTPFDAIPASATAITIRIIGDLDVQAAANSNFTLTANHASDNAGIISGGNFNTFQVLGRSNADSNGRVGNVAEVKIPWVNNRIKTRYTIAGTITVSDLRFFLVGFDAN